MVEKTFLVKMAELSKMEIACSRCKSVVLLDFDLVDRESLELGIGACSVCGDSGLSRATELVKSFREVHKQLKNSEWKPKFRVPFEEI